MTETTACWYDWVCNRCSQLFYEGEPHRIGGEAHCPRCKERLHRLNPPAPARGEGIVPAEAKYEFESRSDAYGNGGEKVRKGRFCRGEREKEKAALRVPEEAKTLAGQLLWERDLDWVRVGPWFAYVEEDPEAEEFSIRVFRIAEEYEWWDGEWYDDVGNGIVDP